MDTKIYFKYLTDLNKNGNVDNLNEIYKKYYDDITNVYTNNKAILGASSFNKTTLLIIDKLSIKELKVALIHLNKIYPMIYKNYNTVKSYYSTIRTKIKKEYGIDSNQYLLSQDLMKQPIEIKKKLEAAYKLKTKEKNRNKIIFNLEDVYSVIDEALSSDNLFDQLVGLMLCSGARTKEILIDNTYQEHPTAEGYIIISNIGKRREGQINKNDTLQRPLIKITPATFIKLVNKLRNDLSKEMDILVQIGIHKDELHQNISVNLKNACIRLFKRDDFIPKWLRKIYANASYLLFVKNKDKYDRNTFLSDVLGHLPTDTSTSASYSVINVIQRPIRKKTLQLQINELKLITETLQLQINELMRRLN